MHITELLLLAIQVSLQGGQEILDVYKTKFVVDHKEDNSPLTLADQRSHDVIMKGLSVSKYPIMSEEGVELDYALRKDWKEFWCVDPLDGTREFVKRNGEFTVNVALVRNESPVLGVIYVPVQDLLYAAADGKAYIIRQANNKFTQDNFSLDNFTLRRSDELKSSFKVLLSRSHLSKETENYVEQLKKDHANLEFVSAGSALKFGWLAEGKADLYPRFSPCMEWDTAAGHAILKTVGKNIYSYPSGDELRYNKINLVNDWFIAR